MTKRIRVVKAAIETREEMERLCGEIAELVIGKQALTDELNGRLLEERSRYEKRLTEIGDSIDEKMPVAQDWAERNRDTFGNKKSLELVHAVVGFRTGTPKLKTATGWTWDAVKAWLVNHSKGYTRTEVSVDKEGIIADRETLGEDGLRKMGVKVVQDEAFFIEPKQETPVGN